MSSGRSRIIEPKRVCIAIAAMAGCITIAFLYAAIRLIQALLFTEPDPALIIYSEHAGFFWRGWISVYAGGMVAFATYIAATRDTARTVRVLVTALTIAIALVFVQGLLVP